MADIVNTYSHDEIRAHGQNEDFNLKNKTLEANLAEMAEGTVMGQVTASKLIKPWDPLAADGSEVPVGILKSKASSDFPAPSGRTEPTGVYARGNFPLAKLTAPDNTWIALMGGYLDVEEGIVYI